MISVVKVDENNIYVSHRYIEDYDTNSLDEIRGVNPPPMTKEGYWMYVNFSWQYLETYPPKSADAVKQEITDATSERLNSFAQTRKYDGILSLCTYATSTNPTFAKEGQYGVDMRDATWAKLYEMLAEVEAGTRPTPTGYVDIEAELPDLVWPL